MPGRLRSPAGFPGGSHGPAECRAGRGTGPGAAHRDRAAAGHPAAARCARSTCPGSARWCATCPRPRTAGSAATGTSPPRCPAGSVLIAIGDVAGHGLAAAAGMARLRGALAGLAITGAAPERLRQLAERPGPARRAGAHRVGHRGLLRPGDREADLGPGRPSAAGAGPRGLGPAADPPAGVLLGAGTGCYTATSAQLDAGRPAAALQRRAGRAAGPVAGRRPGQAGRRRARQRRPGAARAAVLDALRLGEPEDDTCLVALQIL